MSCHTTRVPPGASPTPLSLRHERLCHWLALETWVGMVVDAMLCSGQDASASQIYKQMLGEAAAGLLDDILAPLVSSIYMQLAVPAVISCV